MQGHIGTVASHLAPRVRAHSRARIGLNSRTDVHVGRVNHRAITAYRQRKAPLIGYQWRFSLQLAQRRDGARRRRNTSSPSPAVSKAAPRAMLPDAALKMMNQPQFASGRWAISVQCLDTGKTLIDLEGGKLADPGPFVKTFSAGTGWVKGGRTKRSPPR